MNSPSVATIVLNWNRLEDTSACCASLSGQTYKNQFVWVVDNGSTAHSVSALEEACPAARIIALPENLGFAGGVNAGVRAAWQQADYFWLVNNDATCFPATLSRLVQVAEHNHLVGAVGCAREERDSAGNQESVLGGMQLRPPFFIPTRPRSNNNLDYLCGASLLLRKQAVESVGLLDEGFFFFFEDADWCTRAQNCGWELYAIEDPLLCHQGSGTIKTMRYERAAYYRAGYIRYLRKYSSFPKTIAWSVTSGGVLAFVLRGCWAEVKGTLAGWRNGWSAPITQDCSH